MNPQEQTQLTIVAICTIIAIALTILIPYLYSRRKTRPKTPLYDKAIKDQTKELAKKAKINAKTEDTKELEATNAVKEKMQ